MKMRSTPLECPILMSYEQRSKLLEIAEKCPVHRTLVSEINIRSRVLEQLRTSVRGNRGPNLVSAL